MSSYIDNAEDLRRLTPLSFLGRLKRSKVSPIVIKGQVENWVEKEHLPQLLRLVDVKTPCASVAMSISSVSPIDPSYIGQEALFMIMAIKRGKYPPDLNSNQSQHESFGAKQRHELILWAKKAGKKQEKERGNPPLK